MDCPTFKPGAVHTKCLQTCFQGILLWIAYRAKGRMAAAGVRGTSFAAPLIAACCTLDPPTIYELRSFPPSHSEEKTSSLFSRSCVGSCVIASRQLVYRGPRPLYWSAGGQTREPPGGSILLPLRFLKIHNFTKTSGKRKTFLDFLSFYDLLVYVCGLAFRDGGRAFFFEGCGLKFHFKFYRNDKNIGLRFAGPLRLHLVRCHLQDHRLQSPERETDD